MTSHFFSRSLAPSRQAAGSELPEGTAFVVKPTGGHNGNGFRTIGVKLPSLKAEFLGYNNVRHELGRKDLWLI